jgi:cysteinyl-tRNA synthetase
MRTLGGQKMPKSEKRFFLIEDVLAIPSQEVRFTLSTHYRSPIEFNEERLSEAREAYGRLRQAVERGGGFEPDAQASSDALDEAAQASIAGFHEAMADDFNTAGALGDLFDLARTVNRLADASDSPGARGAARARKWSACSGSFSKALAARSGLGGPRLVSERRGGRRGIGPGRTPSGVTSGGSPWGRRAEGPKLKRKD